MAKKQCSDIVRFWRHVQYQEDGCWVWTAAKDWDGYGLFKVYPRMARATRFLWEHLHGPIPTGMQVHHVCENVACVNPSHLELLSAKDHAHKSANNITYLNLHKSHCPRGHELTPENTYVYMGLRTCSKCRKDRNAQDKRNQQLRKAG